MQILKEAAPHITRVGVLRNPLIGLVATGAACRGSGGREHQGNSRRLAIPLTALDLEGKCVESSHRLVLLSGRSPFAPLFLMQQHLRYAQGLRASVRICSVHFVAPGPALRQLSC